MHVTTHLTLSPERCDQHRLWSDYDDTSTNAENQGSPSQLLRRIFQPIPHWQGMSEAKVEKIKVTFVLWMTRTYVPTFI